MFDAVLCIGVIHHFVTCERQCEALSELHRIVKPGGVILLYAWAWEQPRRKVSGDFLVSFTLILVGGQFHKRW